MDITIYSLPTCEFCNLTKEYFNGKKIPFIEVNVSADQKAQREMLEKSGQFSVPVVDINGYVVVGYQRHIFDQLLNSNALEF